MDWPKERSLVSGQRSAMPSSWQHSCRVVRTEKKTGVCVCLRAGPQAPVLSALPKINTHHRLAQRGAMTEAEFTNKLSE